MTEQLYTPDLAGSGQFAKCTHCKLLPIKDGSEVYDGCLGKLEGDVINACCGHGRVVIAYIQYSDGNCIRGEDAIKEQYNIINKRISG